MWWPWRLRRRCSVCHPLSLTWLLADMQDRTAVAVMKAARAVVVEVVVEAAVGAAVEVAAVASSLILSHSFLLSTM